MSRETLIQAKIDLLPDEVKVKCIASANTIIGILRDHIPRSVIGHAASELQQALLRNAMCLTDAKLIVADEQLRLDEAMRTANHIIPTSGRTP